MAHRGGRVFSQVLAHPGDAVAFDDVIGVDQVFNPGDGRDVAPDDDGGFGRDLAHDAAHLPDLAHVDHDGGDSNYVVPVRLHFTREVVASGKIQDRAGCRDVFLDHQDAPGAV